MQGLEFCSYVSLLYKNSLFRYTLSKHFAITEQYHLLLLHRHWKTNLLAFPNSNRLRISRPPELHNFWY